MKTTDFACGCCIIRNEDWTLYAVAPCPQHTSLGSAQEIADALELPHIAVSVGEAVDVKSLFGGR